MCTYVTEQAAASGSGKGAAGWFPLSAVTVYYDHQVHAQAEHTMNIDFANPERGAGSRVAVELTTETAVDLVRAVARVLAQVPAVKAAMFVRMAPKSRLPTHRDPFAGSLRFHLGLRTPNSEKCRITVDGQTYWWKDGEGVLFD